MKLKWIVEASTRLNYYPGTMIETPLDYRFRLASDTFDTKAEAQSHLAKMRTMIQEPGHWTFEIHEVKDYTDTPSLREIIAKSGWKFEGDALPLNASMADRVSESLKVESQSSDG
jgi:hypothetical protein